MAAGAEAVHQIGERWAVVMDRVDGPALAAAALAEPGRAPELLADMARLHRRIHGHPGIHLGSLKGRLAANIRQATMLGAARQRTLLAGLAGMPDGDRLCHGDFHPWNVLGLPGRAMVVDWPDASSGDPAADVCRSWVLMRPHVPDLAAAYVDTYTAAAGERGEAVFQWLPFVAAARLAENVPAETDALLEMAGSP